MIFKSVSRCLPSGNMASEKEVNLVVRENDEKARDFREKPNYTEVGRTSFVIVVWEPACREYRSGFLPRSWSDYLKATK